MKFTLLSLENVTELVNFIEKDQYLSEKYKEIIKLLAQRWLKTKENNDRVNKRRSKEQDLQYRISALMKELSLKTKAEREEFMRKSHNKAAKMIYTKYILNRNLFEEYEAEQNKKLEEKLNNEN